MNHFALITAVSNRQYTVWPVAMPHILHPDDKIIINQIREPQSLAVFKKMHVRISLDFM